MTSTANAATAAINDEVLVRANAVSALSNRSSTLESQMTGATGSALLSSINSEASTRSSQYDSLAVRTSNLEANVHNPGSGIFARLSTEEAVRASETSALASRSSVLEARAPSINLLDNTDFTNSAASWGAYYGLNGGAPTFGRDIAGDPWRIFNEHNLSGVTTQGANAGEWGWYQNSGGITPGAWYGIAALGSSHRLAFQRVLMRFHDANNNILADYEDRENSPTTGGSNPAQHRQFWVKAQAPANAQWVQTFLLSGHPYTAPDGYFWWHRPQLVKLDNGSQSLAPQYQPGGNRSDMTARISEIATVSAGVAGLNAQYGVEVSAGKVTGFKLNSSATRSDFIISADNFQIVSPTGGARTEYSGGNWRVYDGAGTLRVRMGIW